jgi:hypothetical protein
VDGGISDVHPRLVGQLQGLVVDLAMDVVETDLLEADGVSIEGADRRDDALEALVGDVPPPARRERLARSDRGPDVPGRDSERCARYLTDPASRPWTK